jgi:hypothetical protein
MTEPINGGLSPQGREELKLVASLGLGHVIAQEAERKAKDMAKNILRGSKGSLNDTLLTMATLLRELVEEHVALKAHVVELEQKPGLAYQGTWDEQKVYHVGDFVTDGGSLFCCRDSNVGVRPGSSDAWQLAVKRGKDGRDRRVGGR